MIFNDTRPIRYKNIAGIYKISNTINNKVYIGSTVNLYDRYHNHKSRVKRNAHENYYFQKDVCEYGLDSFVFEVIELCEKDNLKQLESRYMDEYKSYNEQFGYNIMIKEDSTFSREKRVSTREKISKSLKEIGHLKGDKNPMKNEESRKKSIANRVAKGERNPFYRKSHSEETKVKLSNSRATKLNESNVIDIKRMLNAGMKNIDIANIFNVHPEHISKIKRGKRWSHIKLEDEKYVKDLSNL